MKASLDSVSLIFLLKTPDLIPLVQSYFDGLYITDTIYDEVFRDGDAQEIRDIVEPFFQVKNPKKVLVTNLGKGELSAISLAFEDKLAFISEDRKAMQFARSLGLDCSSILSVLVRATGDGRIPKEKARKILDRLVLHGFYMSPELFSFILQKIE